MPLSIDLSPLGQAGEGWAQSDIECECAHAHLSCSIGIYKALWVLCEDTDDVRDWLIGAYNGSIFQGRALLAVI